MKISMWWFIMFVVIPLIKDEIMELAPWIARQIVRFGARLIMNRALSARYKEEWLAEIEGWPGKVTKIVSVFGLVVFAVPKFNYLLFDLFWQRKIGVPITIVLNLRNLRRILSINLGFRLGSPPAKRRQAHEFNRALATVCRWVRSGDVEKRNEALQLLGDLVNDPPPWVVPSVLKRFATHDFKKLTEALERRDATWNSGEGGEGGGEPIAQ